MTDSATDSEEFKSLLKSIVDFLKTVPFKELYQVVITFGGFWLFAFFISIGRLPDFDVTTAITLLLSIAIGGVFITGLICAYFLMPSFFLRQIWAQILSSNLSLPLPATEKELHHLFSIASFLCFLVSLLLLVLLIIATSSISFADVFSNNIAKALATLLLLLYFYLDCERCRIDWLNLITCNKKFLWIAVQLTALWFMAWLFLFILFIEPMANAADKGKWFDFVAYIGFIFNVFLFNSIAVRAKTVKQKIEYLAFTSLAIITLVSFIISLTNGANLIKAPFKMLNLGEISNVRLIVKSDSCKHINTFEPKTCTLIYNQEFGVMSNVKIVSMIGNEFLISTQRSQIGYVSLRKHNLIAIKKEDVLTWDLLTKEQSVANSLANTPQ